MAKVVDLSNTKLINLVIIEVTQRAASSRVHVWVRRVATSKKSSEGFSPARLTDHARLNALPYGRALRSCRCW